ncbi:MAG: SMC-Scp complex subunit ScpB, partial [Alphaproteobacteria bacterium]|nr:SMC-Scp complex subunit ScpB [Alphaproteobacteria bacterium]
SSKGSLDILLDYNWIEIAGKKDIPGRPILYRTTKKFLLDFNLSDINELPNLSELKRDGLLSSLEGK